MSKDRGSEDVVEEIIDDLEEAIVIDEDIPYLLKDELFVKGIFDRLDMILVEVTKLTQRVYILETKLYTDPRVATWLRTINK